MQKSKFSVTKILWFTAGLFLFGGAVLVLFYGKNNLVDISTFLGIAMLFSGIVNIFIYRRKKYNIHGARWLLADGMSTSLLSLFLLFNQMIQSALIPFFFGVWELFSGILKFIDSKELKSEKIYGWHCFLGIGIIEMISGIAALLKPVDDFVGMHIVVALVLIIQSCGYLFKILIYPSLKIKNE